MPEDFARLRLDLSGGDLQQGRFARPVAADKTDPVTRFDLQLGTVKQRRTAEGKPDIVKFQNGRRHAQAPEKSWGRAMIKRPSGIQAGGQPAFGHIRDGARRAESNVGLIERILRTRKRKPLERGKGNDREQRAGGKIEFARSRQERNRLLEPRCQHDVKTAFGQCDGLQQM
jgi:hypothetical protein